MTSRAHPGFVEMVDEEKGTKERVPVSDVPRAIAFIGDEPVVRVVHSAHAGMHTIRSYSESGKLLSTTTGR
jgi:hypothetical protein